MADIALTEDKGVMKRILKEGTPDTKPPKGSEVFVHYVGTLQSDGSKFDSSRDRDEPFSFKLGAGRVIKGWDIGVATMNLGEHAVFTISPEYGYGSSPAGDKIPANSTLIFDVELLRYNDQDDISPKHDGSILKKVISNPDSNVDTPSDESTVTVSYTMKVGEKEIEKKDKYSFIIGDEIEPEAFEKGILSMSKGEHSIITIKCDAQGMPSKNVEANAVVVYDITLEEFEKPKAEWQMTVEEKFDTCTKKRAEGNDLYRKGRPQLALKRYKRALSCVESEYQMSDDDKKKAIEQKIPLFLNVAACMMAKKDYREAIANCNKALDHDKSNIKALIRRAKCYNFIDEWDNCQSDLDKVLTIDSGNEEAKKELASVKRKRAAQDQKDKKRFKSFFGAKMSKLEEEDKKKQELFDEETKKINTLPKKEEDKKCCCDESCKDGCCKDGCCKDCKCSDNCECKKQDCCKDKCCNDCCCKDECCKDECCKTECNDCCCKDGCCKAFTKEKNAYINKPLYS